MNSSRIARRDFLRYASVGALGLASGRLGSWASSARRGALSESVIALDLAPATQSIFPGATTDVWKFQGALINGSGNTSLQVLPNSYLGPIIRTARNETLRIQVSNNLPESSVVHWHGLDNPPTYDGHPGQAVDAGGHYEAVLPIVNRAGTYWYHPHPDMLTGGQVYRGLAGMIIVSDDEEQALNLPRLEFDVPLVLQDRQVGSSNQFEFEPVGDNGMLGDRILVNGRPDFVLSASTRAYRFRILNGSNARIYKLSWENQLEMVVIGTDGGLLRTPVSKPYVTLAPGERVELWVDLTQEPVGRELVLRSLAFSGVGGTAGAPLPQGVPFDVLRVRVDRALREYHKLPTILSSYDDYDPRAVVNRAPRRFPISKMGPMFVLNGGPFQMNLVAPNENVKLGALEVWEFSNPAGSSHLAHPIHIHGPQFQVLERIIAPSRIADWETVRHGYTDEGWKDTVLLMPGETVRILNRFHRYAGPSMYHCHNLEHEDMGMMRNLSIQG